MKVGGVHYRTIWHEDGRIRAIDQRPLPHDFELIDFAGLGDMAFAIREMQLRGAPLIGAAAAFGFVLAMREDPSDTGVERAAEVLAATRPTAVNLGWAIDRALATLRPLSPETREAAALGLADRICDEDVATNVAIGEHALARIRAHAPADGPVRILTHCNAGWLATVDRGTATSGIYAAHDAGLPVHVWVDETRPRGQGRRLTAWELGEHGVPHTVLPDTAAGHLMARGEVDLVIVGTDRTTASGDAANKIGTYPVALAAADQGVPFYVAAPSSSIDWTLTDGRDIPIEERDGHEVSHVSGITATGERVEVRVLPENSPVVNHAFDVTPARLVTGLITERGVAEASRAGLTALFPERAV